MIKNTAYLCAFVLACDPGPSTTTATDDGTTTAGSTTDDAGSTDAAVTGGAVGDGCGAKVLIAFYTDAECTDQVGMRTYDTGLACFSWTAAGSNAMENSATRFQCYADRLCYTQHPNSLTCTDGGFGRTDKQAMLDTCLKEPEGKLYSKLISGTEACPAAPEGFDCPLSAAKEGTDGIVACGE